MIEIFRKSGFRGIKPIQFLLGLSLGVGSNLIFHDDISSQKTRMQRFDFTSSSDGASSEPPPRKRPREESSETSDGTGSDSVDGSESDSASSSSLLAQKPVANLLLSQMSAFHEEVTESSTKDQSVNAKSAMSKKRIAQALKKPCNCDRKCGKRLSFQVVLATVQLFWSLSKSTQDALLWALQQFQRTANL